jgi:protein SCO1/2
MRKLIFICGLLLHMVAASSANAISTSITATNDAAGTSPVFDYDRALEVSQAAIGNQLGKHEFIDADGSVVTFAQLRGKPLVLSMIFTSCYQICPMTTRHLSKIVQKARDALGDDSFNVAIIGFDTAVDTPDAMRFFAAKQGISDRGWRVLSADALTIEALSEDLGFQFFSSSKGFDHLIQATVIDAEGKVYRQVYGQVFDTPLLVDPLIELVLGRSPPEQPLLAGLFDKIKLFCTTYDPVRDGYYFDYSLFLGMLIGGTIILFTGTIVVRGWRAS